MHYIQPNSEIVLGLFFDFFGVDQRMKNIMKFSIGVVALAVSLAVNATPTLQVYMPGAAAVDGSVGGLTDDDTWLKSTAQGTVFDLQLMGNYGNNITMIKDAIVVFTTSQSGSFGVTVAPNGGANYDLTGIVSSYDDDTAFEMAIGASLNNHSPYGGAAANVQIYTIALNALLANLGAFANSAVIPNCDASSAGTASCTVGNPNQRGEVKTLGISFSGVDWVHIDLVARVTNKQGTTSWDINPGSHDSTWTKTSGGGAPPASVPEPGVLLLMGAGLLGLVAARRKSAPA